MPGVLLVDGSSVGEDADSVQARAGCSSEERAREELRTSAYLSDRGGEGSFCATCRGVGGRAFESRCCVRGLRSIRRLRRGGGGRPRQEASATGAVPSASFRPRRLSRR